jgi:hypothetical protein
MHSETQYSLNRAEGKAMLKEIFSDANAKKAGVRIDSAHMNCPKDT